MFKNKTVVIVAGGPSLQGFDFRILNNCNVIAVNRAFQWTKPRVTCFWDGKFFEKWEAELYDHGGKLVSIKQGLPQRVFQFDPNDINCNVNNSGHFAIAVALYMRAEWILLLGFDMQGAESWYTYPSEFKRADNGNKVRSFDMYAGERIINCTPGSALYQFPNMEITKALKYYANNAL